MRLANAKHVRGTLIVDVLGKIKCVEAHCFPRGGVLPYITYIGMCRCEGYGFQAVWSGIGYRNQGVLVSDRVSITGKLMGGVKI